jgi:energy-coupling factor transport system ATP-binding protein
MAPSFSIDLRDVTFAYRNATAPVLKGITLRVRTGEFLGIVAPVGSGKSTLLYLMAGVIPHYVGGQLDGEVLIHGRDTRSLSLPAIAAHVGLVMQDPETQLFNLLVRDEVVWGLENRGVSREEAARLLGETLRFFQIESLQDRITYDLSGGEQQRVALAAVYATRPAILLLDHPTSQLDPLGTVAVIDNIRRLIEYDVTIVMVEDKIDELLGRADRLVLLDHGRIVLDAPPRDFCAQREILAGCGIHAPQVTELAWRLRDRGLELPFLPITVAEAEGLFHDLLDSGGNGAARRLQAQ